MLVISKNNDSLHYVLNVYNESNSDILYVALELDEQSQSKLKHLFATSNPWNDHTIKLICHHSTIAFGKDVPKVIDWVKANEGNTIKLVANELGFSDKACAVKIITESKVPFINTIHHVTLATNLTNKGKPVDSNYITNWNPVQDIELNGIVKIYYK